MSSEGKSIRRRGVSNGRTARMVLKLQAGGDLSAPERWLSEAVPTGAVVGSRVGRQAMVFCTWERGGGQEAF